VSSIVLGTEFIEQFRDQDTVTVATGVTCAYLGDERNLREYLVADELVKSLRKEGHIVHFLLFDDDLDPLTFRQLRVAVNKNQALIDQFEPYCGKPISDIRSPYPESDSFSRYFESQFLKRLNELGCNPTLIRASNMYSRGLYTPYVRQVLLEKDRIIQYLTDNFAGYHPERLYRPVCPTCGYMDCSEVASATETEVRVECHRCGKSTSLSYDELKGKLNWKLDCAVRWAIFGVNVEPFNKAYLEPKAGSFYVAQGISKTFFGGSDVMPLHYGTVSMPKELGYKLLECLPTSVFRSLFVKNHRSDLDINEERVVVEASRADVLPEYSFLDVVKQLLPAWILDCSELSTDQRELMAKGMAFSREFLKGEVKPVLPNRERLEKTPTEVLCAIQNLLQRVIVLREAFRNDYESFIGPTKITIEKLGEQRKAAIKHLRMIIGQEQGVPNSRFLYLLPLSYLQNLESMIGLYLAAKGTPEVAYAVVDTPHSDVPLSVVKGDRLAMEF
jgi:hypothetical protein